MSWQLQRRRLATEAEEKKDRTDEAAVAASEDEDDLINALLSGPTSDAADTVLGAGELQRMISAFSGHHAAPVSQAMNQAAYDAEIQRGDLVVRPLQTLTSRLIKYGPYGTGPVYNVKRLYALDPDKTRGFVNLPHKSEFDPARRLPDLEVAHVRGNTGVSFGPHPKVREIHALLSFFNWGSDGNFVEHPQDNFLVRPGPRTEHVVVHLRFSFDQLRNLRSAVSCISNLGILPAERLRRVDIHVLGWQSHLQIVMESVTLLRRNIAGHQDQDQSQPDIHVYLGRDDNMLPGYEDDTVRGMDDIYDVMQYTPHIAPNGFEVTDVSGDDSGPFVVSEHEVDAEEENPEIAEIHLAEALRKPFPASAPSENGTEPLTGDEREDEEEDDDEDEEKENPMTLEEARDKLEELRQDRRQYLDNINQLKDSFYKMPHAMSYNQAGDAIDELAAQFDDQLDIRDEDKARILEVELQSDVDADAADDDDDGDDYSNPDADAYA